MKPPVLAYAAPASVDECVTLLAGHGDEARVIAGGQSLMPLLALRMVRPAVVVDIARIPELGDWRVEDGTLRIGAMVRQRRVERDPALAAAAPLLAAAVTWIGHPATRSRGTVVGSLCHADPAAELPVCACLLEAQVIAVSSTGERHIPAADFFVDALSTDVRDDEMVTGVVLPAAHLRSGVAFREISRRHGDFALVAAGGLVALDEAGRVARAAVALGGVAGTPVRFDVPEITGSEEVSTGALEAAGARIAAGIEPATDLHASADYRRAVTPVLVEAVLRQALDRARRQEQE